jgi:hypothetical protein
MNAFTFSGKGQQQWGFDGDGNRSLSREQLDCGFAKYMAYYGR